MEEALNSFDVDNYMRLGRSNRGAWRYSDSDLPIAHSRAFEAALRKEFGRWKVTGRELTRETESRRFWARRWSG